MNKPIYTVQSCYGNNNYIGYVVVNSETNCRMGPDGVWRTPDDNEKITYETESQAQRVADFFNGIKPPRSREVKLPELEVKCTACNGLGKTQNWETCSECGGRGVIVTTYGQHILDFVRKHK